MISTFVIILIIIKTIIMLSYNYIPVLKVKFIIAILFSADLLEVFYNLRFPSLNHM